MSKPQTKIQQIIRNDPALAVPLFDVLVFMAMPGAADTPDYDEMLDMCYPHTPDYRAHREEYEKARAAA